MSPNSSFRATEYEVDNFSPQYDLTLRKVRYIGIGSYCVSLAVLQIRGEVQDYLDV